MATKSESTPRPWKTLLQGSSSVVDLDGFLVAQCNSRNGRENAALIVRAVNNHEALLSALSELVEAYEDKHPDRPCLVFAREVIERATS